MKAAHMSDLHYCPKHLEWVDKAFTFAVDDAISRGAEVAFVTGDSFDAAVALHDPAVVRLLRAIGRLADSMPVVILQGTFSHDRPGCLDVFKHMRGRFPILVADRIGQWALTDVGLGAARTVAWEPVLEPQNGIALLPIGAKLIVSALPSINRAAVQANTPDAVTSDLVADLCRAWAVTNAGARARGIPTVAISHGTVNGCVTESKQAMVSPDHEFSSGTLFLAEASAFMLGHIHLYQAWQERGRQIAYPGSITKLIYGHAGDNGYLLWDIGADGAAHELVRTPERRLIDITYKGPPDIADLTARLADCRDAYVRLRYTIDEEHRHTVDVPALRELLRAAGVADFKIEPSVNPVQRSRAAGIHKAASTADKLRRWCELTGTEADPLIQRLSQLEAGQQPGITA